MKYVALLRGINVGGNNKISMSELKQCFERLGFKQVSTYINSGNIIFETHLKKESVIVEKIEKSIIQTFGFPVRVVVRNRKNIEMIAGAIPEEWKNDTEQKTDILFLWDTHATQKSLLLIKSRAGVDNLMYVEGVIVWNVNRENYSKSGMHDFIGTPFYKNMTARNVNTVRKLVALMQN